MSTVPSGLSENFLDALPSDSPRSVSKLAITSLVLSLVFCCPLTTLAGIVTGALAVAATVRDRNLAGRWIAIVAIVISSIATIGQTIVLVKGYDLVFVPIMSGPQTALRAGESGDLATFQQSFTSSAVNENTAENARVFLAALTERYGAFTTASLDTNSASSQPPAAGQDFIADYQLDFAKGRIRATCTIELADATGQLSLKLKSVVIHDVDRGDLRYPPTPTNEKP